MKSMALALAFCSISACSSVVSDADKLQELDRRCAEHASEFITDNAALGSLNLSEYASGIEGKVATQKALKGATDLNAPIGSAHLSVLDLEYSPESLVRTLLMPPEAITEIRYAYSFGIASMNCQRRKSVVISSEDEVRNKIVRSCSEPPQEADPPLSRYNVLLAYGEVDKYDIRPFMFWINDRTNGRVLAEQVSFQLLRGGMSAQNRALLAWGGAQGVKNCRLTPPDQVVKRVFRDVSPGAQQTLPADVPASGASPLRPGRG